MSESRKYEPPASNNEDKVYALIRATVGSIPVVGNAAVELMSTLFSPSLERRRMLWMEEIANSLRNLDKSRQINLDDLQTDEVFITTLVQASEAAVQNHQQEKIQALRNAVLNSALGIDIDEDLQLTFIRYINELTPSHFNLLTFFRNNEPKFERVESYEELFQAFSSRDSSNKIEHEEFKLLCSDLISRVLIRISPNVADFNDIGDSEYLVTESNGESRPLLRVTNIGKKLLDFISAH